MDSVRRYGYRKFVRYEDAAGRPAAPTGIVTEIPAGLLPERPSHAEQSVDPVLSEYNAYLAELAEKDKRKHPMTETPEKIRSALTGYRVMAPDDRHLVDRAVLRDHRQVRGQGR